MYIMLFVVIPIYSRINDYRFRLTKELLETDSSASLVIVDSSPEPFSHIVRELTEMNPRNYYVYGPDLKKGGAIRRGIEHALSLSINDSDMIGFQEPEKVDMLRHYEETDTIAMFRRASFDTCPKEQHHQEMFINHFMTNVIEHDYDWTFGPILFNKRYARYFLECHEDDWNAQIEPVVRALHAGVKVQDVIVDFQYSKEQKENEENNMSYIEKRLKQANYWFSKYAMS